MLATASLTGAEWSLAHVMLLNAAVLAGAWRFARRRLAEDWIEGAAWAIALWLLVQYASVMLPAIAGVLNLWTMSACGIALGAALWLSSGRADPTIIASVPEWDRRIVWLCILFFAGYLAALLYHQREMPPLGDDGLAYHLPTAVRWLQTGRLALHEIWFLNPAATYSPLLGSSLLAWWMAPMGCDWLARFVQAPGLVLVFFAILRLCRSMGARPALAAATALAASLSRSMISQVPVVKDDLYLVGFLLLSVTTLSRASLEKPSGTIKVGIAVGLFLATKLTALMAMPILALAVDAPFRARWRWRHFMVAGGIILTLAAPWYVRTWWMTGNPLYPADIWIAGWQVFPGMFTMAPSSEFETPGGVWRVLTGAYFSMPSSLFIVLAGVWAGYLAVFGRRWLREPVPRIVAFGPPLGIAVFIMASQFAEVRYAYPAFALMFAAAAAVAGAGRSPWQAVATASILLLLSIPTAFEATDSTISFVVAGAVMAGLGFVLGWAAKRGGGVSAKGWIGGTAALLVALGLWAYVYLDAVIRDYRDNTSIVWISAYGELGEAWAFVRENSKPGTVIAYTNSHFVYPLFGFEWDRAVVYAPTRPNTASLQDLPRVEKAVAGERLIELVVAPVFAHADRDVWLSNLNRTGADCLFVAKEATGLTPPELAFVRQAGGRFRLLFENDAAAIYRVSQ